MKRVFSIALALTALSACDAPPSEPVGAPVITVRDAWCRPTPNGARAGACYAILRADRAEATLVAVSSPLAAAASVHQMSVAHGRMSMSEMEDGLPLPVGRSVVLAPGGTHLMLTGLAGPLIEGGVAPLTLTFADGQSVTVDAAIRRPAT